MNGWESVKMAWNGLAGNKMRSLLTMLGVIIGVGAVIALVSVGEGTKRQVTDQIQSLGSNLIMVTPRGNTAARLTVEDAAELEKRVPSVAHVIPDISRSTTVKWQDQTYDTTVEGTTDAYPDVRQSPLMEGRFLTSDDVDNRRKVAVVGYQLVTDLFGGRQPIGQTVSINGEPYTVVGVMAQKGQGQGSNMDDRVFIPITSALRLLGTNRVTMYYAQAKSSDQAQAAVDHITAIYQAKYPTRNPGKDDMVQVISQDQILSTVGNVTQILTLMLGGIAGVSLLVGGIGIMNIMLVSVTERTREIGIRKALGAKRRDILSQFLVESIILSVAGGIIGIGLGSGGAFLINLSQLKTHISLSSVLLAFFFAAAVGLFFGVYPAAKAANLDPIEALRYE
ncbi:MAG: ABC transporter permease [Symbiobacteriia bacterium]